MYYVYIMTSPNNRVLYVGFTSDLPRRNSEHKALSVPGFTKKYHCIKLVYFEAYDDRDAMLACEKEIKKWRREKKNNLVVRMNPNWNDLSNAI